MQCDKAMRSVESADDHNRLCRIKLTPVTLLQLVCLIICPGCFVTAVMFSFPELIPQ